ncbi:hypothetical protein ACFQOZ_17060 [Comamonas endophytica]|uniref:hypothetical protein n=1 Tax=Comamonas endophytica TaxID=2949090 RepID=UPI00360BCCEF
MGTLGHWISNSTPDACDRSLALARLALQQEDARQAGQHARAAIAACEDEKRARRAKAASDDARTLLHAQARTQDRARQPPRPWVQHPRPQQAACEKSNRQTASHLSSGRLVSAGRNLQRIPQACRQLDQTRALIARLDRMQATASKATADARAQLGQGAWGQARTSLQVLASVNRESDDLPELRAVLNRAQPGP